MRCWTASSEVEARDLHEDSGFSGLLAFKNTANSKMRTILLLILFAIIMVFQVISLKEGFGQPGTQVQMQANQPLFFVAAAPVFPQ